MKTDKGLKALADSIFEEEMAESLMDDDGPEVPEEYHQRMTQFMQLMTTETRTVKKKRPFATWGRLVALLAIAFITANAVAMTVSEAYKNRIFLLFEDKENGSVTLTTNDTRNFRVGWKNYWYPADLPEGFELTYASDEEYAYFQLYEQTSTGREIRVFQYLGEMNIGSDTEKLKRRDLKVGIYSGYIFYGREDRQFYAIWPTEEDILEINFSGDFTFEEIEDIANGMQYRE